MNDQTILAPSGVSPVTRTKFAGCRFVQPFRVALDIDVFVMRAVYDAAKTGDDVGGRYHATCETHSTLGPGRDRLFDAKEDAFDDYGWCVECAQLLDKIMRDEYAHHGDEQGRDPDDYAEGDR